MDGETVTLGTAETMNTDTDNLSLCEEWDETDIEVNDSNSVELHPLAKCIPSSLCLALLSCSLPFCTYHFPLYVLPLFCWQFVHCSLVHSIWLGDR